MSCCFELLNFTLFKGKIMFRVLVILLIVVCFGCVGCKKKPAVEPNSVKKEIKVEDITKENMEEELDNLEKQIEDDNNFK